MLEKFIKRTKQSFEDEKKLIEELKKISQVNQIKLDYQKRRKRLNYFEKNYENEL